MQCCYRKFEWSIWIVWNSNVVTNLDTTLICERNTNPLKLLGLHTPDSVLLIFSVENQSLNEGIYDSMCRAWQLTMSMLARVQTLQGFQQRCWQWMAHSDSPYTTLLQFLAFMLALHPSSFSIQTFLLQLVRLEILSTPRISILFSSNSWLIKI